MAAIPTVPILPGAAVRTRISTSQSAITPFAMNRQMPKTIITLRLICVRGAGGEAKFGGITNPLSNW